MLLTKRSLSILLFLYMSVIFFLSHIPAGTNNDLDLDKFQWLTPQIGNLLHIPLYAGLAYLWIKFFQLQQLSEWRIRVWVFVLTLLYAFTDEAHQYFIPGRFSSFSDFVLDAVGVLLILKLYPLVDSVFRIKVSD